MTAKKAAKKAVKAHAPSTVNTIVNGQPQGTILSTGTVGDAANILAHNTGLKSYSVRVNGVPITAEEGAKSLAGVKSLEVFAKDSRG